MTSIQAQIPTTFARSAVFQSSYFPSFPHTLPGFLPLPVLLHIQPSQLSCEEQFSPVFTSTSKLLLESKFHDGGIGCVLFLHLQHPGKYKAYYRHSTNDCWMNAWLRKWINGHVPPYKWWCFLNQLLEHPLTPSSTHTPQPRKQKIKK